MQPIAKMKSKKDPAIYDIAQRLDLSSATVSRALQDDPAINKNTRKKIKDNAKELGYRHNNFASNLRKQKTNTICVVVHELNSNFITSVPAGIEKVTTDAGYPGIDIGEIAARNLINHLRGLSNIRDTQTIVVRSELIIRKSSLKKQNHFKHSRSL